MTLSPMCYWDLFGFCGCGGTRALIALIAGLFGRRGANGILLAIHDGLVEMIRSNRIAYGQRTWRISSFGWFQYDFF